MAGKRITAQFAEFGAVNYNIETRTLLFSAKAQGKSLLFLGVPPDLFYGMPSGTNVRNFIDLKLRGRYSMVELTPPPIITYSLINKEVTVYLNDGTELIYKTRTGEPTAFGTNETEAFQIFQETYGRRAPDETRRPKNPNTKTTTAGPDGDLGLPDLQ